MSELPRVPTEEQLDDQTAEWERYHEDVNQPMFQHPQFRVYGKHKMPDGTVIDGGDRGVSVDGETFSTLVKQTDQDRPERRRNVHVRVPRRRAVCLVWKRWRWSLRLSLGPIRVCLPPR